MKVRVGHMPLEFGDSPAQHTHDLEKIFAHAVSRRWAWITGTEAGPGANNTSSELLRIGRAHGYKMWVPSAQGGRGNSTDCWIAVRKDLVNGEWAQDFKPVIPGSTQLYKAEGLANPSNIKPKWGPKGLVTVHFHNDKIGDVNICAGHPLTKGQNDGPRAVIHGVNHYEWNTKFQQAVGAWGREAGKGSALAFYGGDQNDPDRDNDTFRGQPFTSAADETNKVQNTGHGAIDVIASFNGDGRVKAINWDVLDDSEFQLFVDHWLCEAVFEVQAL